MALGFVIAVACNGGNGGDGDSSDGQPDSGTNPMSCTGCNPPNQCCDFNGEDYCIATSSDFLNCGGCGNKCNALTSDSCGGSQCKCGLAGECQSGDVCCPGQGCKDLMDDPQNCGMCGKQCDPGQTCTNGGCSCGGVTCAVDEKCCGGTCVKHLEDEANCGMCGMTCTGMTTSCNNGTCGCPGGGGACPAPGQGVIPACCGSGCANICTDNANCGECGKVCAANDCFLGGCFSDSEDQPLTECLFGTP